MNNNIPLAIKAFVDNYIWLLISDDRVICVDPGEATGVRDFIKNNNLNLTTILLTHHHFDHINGVEKLKSLYPNVTILGPKDNRLPFLSRALQEERLTINNYQFKILKIPGHTASHIAYYEVNHKWLFCGDTLFSAGCGRVFDSTIEDLFNSLKKIALLDDDTKIFCAHEYTRANLNFALSVEPNNKDIIKYKKSLKSPITLPSTLRLEKKINPFLRTEFLEKYAGKYNLEPRNELAIFRHLRKSKDIF